MTDPETDGRSRLPIRVFVRHVKNVGPNVDPFVGDSQIVELECVCSGLWGEKSIRGRIVSYRSE